MESNETVVDNQVQVPAEGQTNAQTHENTEVSQTHDGQSGNTWEKSYKEYRSYSDRKINELVDEIKELKQRADKVAVPPEPDPVEQLANQYGVDKSYLLANAELANRLAEKKAKEVAEKTAREIENKLRTEFEMQSLKNSTPDWDKYEPVMKELDKGMTRSAYAKLLYEEAKRRAIAQAPKKPAPAPVIEGGGKPVVSPSIDPNKISCLS